jgi:hypothetical protein
MRFPSSKKDISCYADNDNHLKRCITKDAISNKHAKERNSPIYCFKGILHLVI